MIEIIFLVEEDPEGGYTANALGESIITQACRGMSLWKSCFLDDHFDTDSVID